MRELAAIRGVLEIVADRGAALLISGEAGIGKSRLLVEAHAIAMESGYLVLPTAGIEQETSFAFAGLHRLLRPVISGAEKLPGPQRMALLGAFGVVESGDETDVFLVGLAVLTLLSDLASQRPVMVLVDDVHWLDRASLDVIGFIARRIEHDPIVLLATARDHAGVDAGSLGAVELRPAPLTDGDSRALLDLSAPNLDDAARGVVLRYAAGNPLALMELPLALTASGDSRGAQAGVVPLTARVERSFAGRVGDLPRATRDALLVAALDDGDDIVEILAAVGVLRDETATMTDLTPAVDAGLLHVAGSRVAFRHPLVRSAIHQSADDASRRAGHLALATALTGAPERQLLHRSAAVVGADDELADRLEAVAHSAQRRGASLAASGYLERAAELTRDRGVRVERFLSAADIAFEIGQPVTVQRILEKTGSDRLAPLQRGRVEYLAEIFHDRRSGDAARVRTLVALAHEALASDDQQLALRLLSGASLRSFWADPGEEARVEVVAAARQVKVAPDDPNLVLILGTADPMGQTHVVVEHLDTLGADTLQDAGAARLYGMAAQAVGHPSAVIRCIASASDALRRQGRLGLLTHALGVLGSATAQSGDFHVARPALEEAISLGRETAQPIWFAGPVSNLAILEAARGDHDQAAFHIAEAEAIVLPLRLSTIITCVQIAKGVDALARSRNDEAWRELLRIFTPSDASFNLRHAQCAISYLADAAVHTR